MSNNDRAYSFVMRGLLTEEALDRVGRRQTSSEFENLAELERLCAIDALENDYVEKAREMSVVYVAIAAFEMSVRDLIRKVMLENIGEKWWDQAVSEKIRTSTQQRISEEEKVRWHAQRGHDPINYTMLPNLLSIMRQNLTLFEPFVHQIEWAAQIFEMIERSRNVIMHSGILPKRDVARLGSLINDWSRQVSS